MAQSNPRTLKKLMTILVSICVAYTGLRWYLQRLERSYYGNRVMPKSEFDKRTAEYKAKMAKAKADQEAKANAEATTAPDISRLVLPTPLNSMYLLMDTGAVLRLGLPDDLPAESRLKLVERLKAACFQHHGAPLTTCATPITLDEAFDAQLARCPAEAAGNGAGSGLRVLPLKGVRLRGADGPLVIDSLPPAPSVPAVADVLEVSWAAGECQTKTGEAKQFPFSRGLLKVYSLSATEKP